MKRSFYTIAAALFLVSVSATVFADIARPRPRPETDDTARILATRNSPLVIAVEPGTKQAHLLIPRSLLHELAADTAATSATGMLGNITSTRTLIAGMFLSLSFFFCGVWLVRSRRATRSGVAVAAMFAVAAIATTIAAANAGPPPASRLLDPGTLNLAVPQPGTSLSGQVHVQIVSSGSEIRLVVPSAAAQSGDSR